MIACVILWMTSSPGVRPPTKSIIPAIPHILIRLLAYLFLAKTSGFFCRPQLERGKVGEQMGPKGHMRFMKNLSCKVAYVPQIPSVRYPTRDGRTPRFRSNRPLPPAAVGRQSIHWLHPWLFADKSNASCNEGVKKYD